MRATAALSLAALTSALLATSALASELNFGDLDEHEALSAKVRANPLLHSNGNDASSVMSIDASADGSVEAYEG